MAGRYISVNQAIARSGMTAEILKTLQNPEKLAQLQMKGRKLANLFEILSQSVTALSEEIQIEKHQNTILNNLTQIQSVGKMASTMNTSLSRQLHMKKMTLRKKTDSRQINKIIKDIFILEHDILDSMTNKATETTEYAIYYSSNNKNSSEIYRGTINAKQLYKSQYVTADREGNLILKRSVVENQKLMNTWTDKEKNNINIAEQEHYKNMSKIIAAYNVTLQAQYQDLRAIASSVHLGSEKDNKLDALRTMIQGADQLQNFATDIYQRYRGFKNEVNFSNIINRGHLVEAFERFLTLPDDQQMNYESYLQLLKQSLGNDPWYIKGDVGHTQVKSFINSGSARQIASLNSIIELGRRLLQLLNNHTKTLKKISKFDVQKLMQDQTQHADNILNKNIEEEIQLLLNALKFDK